MLAQKKGKDKFKPKQGTINCFRISNKIKIKKEKFFKVRQGGCQTAFEGLKDRRLHH